MIVRLAYTEFRKDLADLLDRVESQGLRVLVERGGRAAAAVVPVRDLELMAALEDHLDEEWTREAVERALAVGGKPIPYEELRRELDLD
jgi:prevent-host-death family protein